MGSGKDGSIVSPPNYRQEAVEHTDACMHLPDLKNLGMCSYHGLNNANQFILKPWCACGFCLCQEASSFVLAVTNCLVNWMKMTVLQKHCLHPVVYQVPTNTQLAALLCLIPQIFLSQQDLPLQCGLWNVWSPSVSNSDVKDKMQKCQARFWW